MAFWAIKRLVEILMSYENIFSSKTGMGPFFLG